MTSAHISALRHFIHARAAAHLQKSQFMSSSLLFYCHLLTGGGGLSDGMNKHKWCVRRFILSDNVFVFL